MTGLSLAQAVRSRVVAAPLLVVLVLSGCQDSYPTDLSYPLRSDPLVKKIPDKQPFYPDPPGTLNEAIAKLNDIGGETLDPNKIEPALRSKLKKTLEDTFGSPAKPLVKADDEGAEAIKLLLLQEDRLAKGSVLYRRHCLHCHGLTGDGRGPTGPWVNPHPRDYRRGFFKFISSEGDVSRKPRREDLLRILKTGVDGTSMPSFALLEEQDLENLASYVIHLSLRGQVEYEISRKLLTGNTEADLEDGDMAAEARKLTQTYLVGQWARSDKRPPILPKAGTNPVAIDDRTSEKYRQSVLNGYKLFTDTKLAANCIGCHTDFGRQAPFRYDEWGTLVRPANLTMGIFRGGRRPIDLFWRIRGGIVPSQMPAATGVTDEQTWDIVNFVQALPYPAMLPEEIRNKIYHTQAEKQLAAE
jgi:mono/diheme cytochrome c family protein